MTDKSQSPDDSLLIRDHEYDGIRELDNPMPAWWLTTFFATIIFGFLYYIDDTFVPHATQTQVAQSVITALKAAHPDTGILFSETELGTKFSAAAANSGQAVFQARCASCHGAHAEGLIGPNLTDNYWIHGTGKRTEILQVIREGVLDKGMPNWNDILSPDEQIQVAAFVYSLRGKNLPGKPPQGTKVE